MRSKRKYQELWERIKRNNRVAVECHPMFLQTVKKGVIKEKFNDKGFKVLNDHDRFSLEISYDRERQKLVFMLRQTLGLEGVKG